MLKTQRRLAVLAALGLGLAAGHGCQDDNPSQEGDSGSTGPELCQAGFVTCPDGTCQAPAQGACCNHGGLCPGLDESGPQTTANTSPTTTAPPTTAPPETGPDESTTDETASTTSMTTTGDESTSTGEPLPSCYDPMSFPWAGPLCGPAAAPCAVQAAETIEPVAAARNGTPSITVDDDCAPAVLHAQTDGGALGFFAQRIADDAWNVQPTPFDMSQGGIGFDAASGYFVAMVYEGAFQVSARSYDGVAWDAGDPLPGSYSLSTKAFANLGDVVLHGVLQQPGVGFIDSAWDGAWGLAPLPSGGPTDVSPSLALAIDGTHHFTYWHSDVAGPVLRWETSTGLIEDVMPYGGLIVQPAIAQEIALTDNGGNAVPHVIAGSETAVGGRVQVIYARRDAVDTWTTYVVASEDPTGETDCDVPPVMPGQLCSLDRTTYRPLAIVSSYGGHVRWLYSETHELVDYASECAPGCVWTPTSDQSTYDVHLGWLEGGVPQSVVLLPDTRLARANLEVDGEGTMHLVAYAEEVPDDAGTGLTVEYFRLAP